MPKFKLSKEKYEWGRIRKNTVIKGDPLNYNAGEQAAYIKSINELVTPMIKEVERSVIRFFEGGLAESFFEEQQFLAAMDASISAQSKKLMEKLTERFTQIFEKSAKTKAERMVDASAKLSANTLKKSLQVLSGGVMLKTNVLTGPLKEVTKSIVTENVSLIKSIGDAYLKRVTGQVLRSITTGNGLSDLIPALRQYKGITERQVKNIALDQTRKTYNAVNKQRMQTVNITTFEWIHSGGGQHPRKDHIALNGKVFSFDNLPVIDKKTGERGIPGQAINCRCTMRPVFKFENKVAA
jgi:SPP1 gp7 family putative phage head morphogenesis protein